MTTQCNVGPWMGSWDQKKAIRLKLGEPKIDQRAAEVGVQQRLLNECLREEGQTHAPLLPSFRKSPSW